ncbi:MAG: peptidoglycan-binding domain-containing protein [Polyangiaceae bacterium]|jgi:hypothetical protein
MQPYIIRQGESLATLALRDGFDPDAVWNDPKNDDIRAKRSDPMVLAPSDIIYLPDQPAQADSSALQTGSDNNFVAPPRPPLLGRLRLLDETGAPVAGKSFVVEDVDPPSQGTTDADGNVDLEIPYGRTWIRVQLPDAEIDLVVQVAFLDPVTESSGLEQRLSALGLLQALPAVHDPDAAAIVAQEYRDAAVRAFQQKQSIPDTGELDDATQKALLDAHGA